MATINSALESQSIHPNDESEMCSGNFSNFLNQLLQHLRTSSKNHLFSSKPYFFRLKDKGTSKTINVTLFCPFLHSLSLISNYSQISCLCTQRHHLLPCSPSLFLKILYHLAKDKLALFYKIFSTAYLSLNSTNYGRFFDYLN